MHRPIQSCDLPCLSYQSTEFLVSFNLEHRISGSFQSRAQNYQFLLIQCTEFPSAFGLEYRISIHFQSRAQNYQLPLVQSIEFLTLLFSVFLEISAHIIIYMPICLYVLHDFINHNTTHIMDLLAFLLQIYCRISWYNE